MQELDMGPVIELDEVIAADQLQAPAPSKVPGTYASPWVADHSATNHTTKIAHKLGRQPNWCQVWFTGSGKQDYLVSWSWLAAASGNPVTISATSDAVYLEIVGSVPLHGVWDASSTQWHYYTKGAWRIVVG